MISLLLIRHGQTEWSREGRIQGRTDTALSTEGRQWLESRRVPAEFEQWRVCTSPLQRCWQSGQGLGLSRMEREPRIIEMDWGEWEGRTLVELRKELGDAMRENEQRGLDLRPEGGETPREVLTRIRPWLIELAATGQSWIALSHRGVIRVILSEAFGWDMLGKPPVKLDWNAAHLFQIDDMGRVRPDRMNLALAIRNQPEPAS